MREEKKLAGIQYLGISGVTHRCRDVIIDLIQSGESIEKARLLTSVDRHCFLVVLSRGENVAIKSGFTSGYSGEGPTALSYVIALFEAFEIDIDELDVDEIIIERIDHSSLTVEDLELIVKSRSKRPNKVYDYISEKHFRINESGNIWKNFKPVIPFPIIDRKIIDLTISFWESPDEKIMTAYRRLEDLLRDKTGLNENSRSLISKAYRGEDAKLFWEGIEKSETEGRVQLMIGVFMAYRNPRAHKEIDHNSEEYLQEFLLINHLFNLVSLSKNVK